VREDHIGLEPNEFARIHSLPIEVRRTPPNFQAHIPTIGPTQLSRCSNKAGKPENPLGVVLAKSHENADATNLGLLRVRRERPRRRAAEQCDAIAPVHSITSSEMARSEGGTVRPSMRAVVLLMTSSNFVDCSTGNSAGFAPLSTRPAQIPH
jgi:hypothetical protein